MINIPTSIVLNHCMYVLHSAQIAQKDAKIDQITPSPPKKKIKVGVISLFLFQIIKNIYF